MLASLLPSPDAGHQKKTPVTRPSIDVQRWWRLEFLDRVADVTLVRGLYDYDIYDAAENRVAQGCMPRPGEEW